MNETKLTNLILDQSKGLFWMIDLHFQLLYANKSYLSLIKEMTGVEKKLNDSVFVEGFSEGYVEKWKAYYIRALKGEYFEIEEHHYHSQSGEIQYRQIIFEPLTGDDQRVFAVACQSKDITSVVKHRAEANQLMDASLDVFCTINEQGNFVYVSAAAAIHWGYSPGELIGKPYLDFILEEDLKKTNEIAAAVLSGQEIKSFLNRYKKKDGGIAYNLWSARWDDSAKLMYCVARDGKDKIEQEEKIQQSEQRFKALVQEGSDLIGILDGDGNYSYVSPTSISVLGIAPEEFLGRNAFDFIHPEDAERTLIMLQKINTESRVIVEPFRFQNHKKEWRWVETVLTNMLDNPAVKGIVANSRDITAKIEEQQILKLLESVITNTKDAILITEAEPFDEPGNRIIYVNEAFTKMTGYEPEEVIGKTPRILQGPNSNKEKLHQLGRSIRKWEPCELTTINYKKSGEEFWLNFTLTPVADEKGWYSHWIAIERDVTEQKIKELEKDLLARISGNFNIENDYISAANELCKSVSRFGKFNLAEVWISNLEKSQMQLFSHYVANPQDEKFYDYSAQVDVFKMSESLVGKVWQQQTQLLWDDIVNNKDFVRRDAAKQIGLNAVLGIPLTFNNEAVAVLMIGTKHGANYLTKYTPIFNRLEGFIGSEFNRKKLENDLSHLFNAIPDILCVADFKGRFLKINKAGCALLGYSEEEILYHTFDEFKHAAHKDVAFSNMLNLQPGESSFKFENRFNSKRGDIIWLSWNCNIALEEGLVYATAKNITEEKKLRELNRQVSSLAKIGSWEMDVVNQTIFWSHEVHQLLETDPKLFVPNLETAINFYREDFHQAIKTKIDKCISTCEPFDYEAVVVTAKKKELWVRAIGEAEFADGVCKRIYGSIQDINSLRETEKRIVSISENLPGVIYQYLIHPDGTESFRYISGAVEQVWGFTANEVIANVNLVWDQIKAGGSYEEVKASMLHSIKTRSRWTCRLKYVIPTGGLRTYLGSGTPSFLSDGTILFNSIILDITQEAQNEELLTQASAMARIGSWELDLVNKDGGSMYWSPMVKEIVEVDDKYNPTLTGGNEFYIGESKQRIQHAVAALISEGREFDEELLLRTGKGHERWIRSIGKSETANNRRTRIYGSFQDIDERKKAAIKLAESENRFRTILEAEPECIKLLGPGGELLMMNPAGLAMIEADNEEQLIGKSMLGILLPVHRSAFSDLTTNVFKGESGKLVFEIKGFKGTHRWLETHAVPMRNEQGNIISLLGVTRDITDRKKAEEDIKDSEEKRRLIMNGALDAIICIDSNDTITFWNPKAESIFGWTEEEVLGQFLSELIIPERLRKYHKQGIKHYLETGEGRILNNLLELSATRRSGTEFPIELTVMPVKQGGELFFCAFLRDITERQKAQQSILQFNERFEKVTEATRDTIWDWDIVTQTFYRSKAIERFFGNQASTSFTQNDFWKEHFHPEDLGKIQDSISAAIANPLTTRWEMEYRIFNELGKTVYVIDRGVIIRNSEGKAVRMVGAMTDISEQKHMTVQLSELNQSLQQHTAELKRSNEELEQFAFVASHDLQEPLRMISSFMDLLQRKYGKVLDEKGNQYIYFATEGAKRMKQIILDLLHYSKAGKPEEGKEEVDLHEVLSEFKQLRRKLIAEKKATIIYKKLPTLNNYKAAITQILHCLLDNAIKYALADTPPIVEIGVVEYETEWEFSIKDNGIGIDPEYYDKIFIIFQRLHNKGEFEGTGIGLSITKRHVEFLGGRIWLESAPGEGSVFYFTIPKTT